MPDDTLTAYIDQLVSERQEAETAALRQTISEQRSVMQEAAQTISDLRESLDMAHQTISEQRSEMQAAISTLAELRSLNWQLRDENARLLGQTSPTLAQPRQSQQAEKRRPAPQVPSVQQTSPTPAHPRQSQQAGKRQQPRPAPLPQSLGLSGQQQRDIRRLAARWADLEDQTGWK